MHRAAFRTHSERADAISARDYSLNFYAKKGRRRIKGAGHYGVIRSRRREGDGPSPAKSRFRYFRKIKLPSYKLPLDKYLHTFSSRLLSVESLSFRSTLIAHAADEGNIYNSAEEKFNRLFRFAYSHVASSLFSENDIRPGSLIRRRIHERTRSVPRRTARCIRRSK